MPALRDLQAAFAAHLAGAAPDPALLGAVRGGAIPAAARLAVYRHHVTTSLAAALATTFPTVVALVGDAFFRRLAGDFVARALPAGPVLGEYGGGLADFLDSWAPAAELPYLADMARLDWAMNLACQAPPAGRLAVADLAALDEDRLLSLAPGLPPGAALLDSAYPLDRIWQASQPAASDEAVTLAGEGCRLLVLPDPPGASFVGLDEGEAAFLAVVARGQSFEAAAQAAAVAEKGFHLSNSFARMLSVGAFAALR